MSQEDPGPRLSTIVAVCSAVLVLGATFYHFVEGLRWVDAFYLATITLATVGYGDFSPKTDVGKIFTIFYVLFGLGLFATLIDALGRRRDEARQAIRLRRDARSGEGP